jgi:hypothetical protein
MSGSHKIENYQGYVRYQPSNPRKRKNTTNLQNRPKREKIGEFSLESRKRLHRETLKIKFSDDFYFVTLTYQAGTINIETEEVEWKEDINEFRKKVYRSIPNLSALWKLEFTKSGLPHYHLITHCPESCATQLRNDIRKEWLKVTGSGSRGRFKHAVKVDQVGNMQAVSRYMSKYISKDASETGQQYVGRFWGYINKSSFPSGTLNEVELTKVQLSYIRRVLACVYVPQKFNDVRKNLSNSDNAFAVYIPYHIQSRLFSPFRRTNDPF